MFLSLFFIILCCGCVNQNHLVDSFDMQKVNGRNEVPSLRSLASRYVQRHLHCQYSPSQLSDLGHNLDWYQDIGGPKTEEVLTALGNKKLVCDYTIGHEKYEYLIQTDLEKACMAGRGVLASWLVHYTDCYTKLQPNLSGYFKMPDSKLTPLMVLYRQAPSEVGPLVYELVSGGKCIGKHDYAIAMGWAITTGNIGIVQKIIDNYSQYNSLNAPTIIKEEEEDSPIIFLPPTLLAIRCRQSEIFKILVPDPRVFMDQISDWISLSFQKELDGPREEMRRYLISNLSQTDRNKVLWEICQDGTKDKQQSNNGAVWMMANGSEPDFYDDEDRNALHYAAARQLVGVLKVRLNQKQDRDDWLFRDKSDKNSALGLLCHYRQTELIRDIIMRCRLFREPLIDPYATIMKYVVSVVQDDYKVDQRLLDCAYLTAASIGTAEEIEILEEAGASQNYRDTRSKSKSWKQLFASNKIIDKENKKRRRSRVDDGATVSKKRKK